MNFVIKYRYRFFLHFCFILILQCENETYFTKNVFKLCLKNSSFKKDPNWGGSGSAGQPIRNPDPGYPPRIKDKIQGQDRGRTAGGATFKHVYRRL